MPDSPTTARADLAAALTSVVVNLPPHGLDGDTIVARLCDDPGGRAAVMALGAELRSEQIRQAASGVQDAITRLGAALSLRQAAKPTEPESRGGDPVR